MVSLPANPPRLTQAPDPILPDPVKTPGAVLTTNPAIVCVDGYASSVRNVSTETKNKIYRDYGIFSREPKEYEIDHLISLQLGGSNDPKNLWPQSFRTFPYNALLKDKLEGRLNWLVCHGYMTLPFAQQLIAGNWIEAYDNFLKNVWQGGQKKRLK